MIKNLIWSEEKDGTSEIPYNHVIAITPFGNIVIDWKGWKEYPSYDINLPWLDEMGGYVSGENTLSETMNKAEREYYKAVEQCLERGKE